jgi:hypothetical protein
MSIAPRLTASVFVFLAHAISASAADMAQVQIGSFNHQSDGPVLAVTKLLTPTPTETTISLAISDFDAKAQGAKTVGQASFSGNFEVMQPPKTPIYSVEIDFGGSIVKTTGSLASIEVQVGDEVKVIEWPEGSSLAEAFRQNFTVKFADGRIPTPLSVQATASVKKSGETAAVDLSLKDISLRINELSTASIK